MTPRRALPFECTSLALSRRVLLRLPMPAPQRPKLGLSCQRRLRRRLRRRLCLSAPRRLRRHQPFRRARTLSLGRQPPLGVPHRRRQHGSFGVALERRATQQRAGRLFSTRPRPLCRLELVSRRVERCRRRARLPHHRLPRLARRLARARPRTPAGQLRAPPALKLCGQCGRPSALQLPLGCDGPNLRFPRRLARRLRRRGRLRQDRPSARTGLLAQLASARARLDARGRRQPLDRIGRRQAARPRLAGASLGHVRSSPRRRDLMTQRDHLYHGGGSQLAVELVIYRASRRVRPPTQRVLQRRRDAPTEPTEQTPPRRRHRRVRRLHRNAEFHLGGTLLRRGERAHRDRRQCPQRGTLAATAGTRREEVRAMRLRDEHPRRGAPRRHGS